MNLTDYIKDIYDWPTEGIVFKDVTPLLSDPAAFKETIRLLCDPYRDKGVTKILAAEARGFMFGSAVAYELGAGFIPARKPGKLPRETYTAEYVLEYGTDCLEVHNDALHEGDVVLIVDDVLATGGTARAKAELVARCGAKLAGYAFLLELDFLNGREKLDPEIEVVSLVHVS